MNDLEKSVANFYGRHHGLFQYRGHPTPNWTKSFLKKIGISPDQFRTFRCLDAGGSGNKAVSCALAGASHVTYMDLSETNISWMRERLAQIGRPALDVWQGSILESHPEFAESFDLIISSGVIHHTADPARALMNFNAWLKPGGVLIFTCSAAESLFTFWVFLLRHLFSVAEVDYEALSRAVDLSDIPRHHKGELMDLPMVPILHPATHAQVLRDLETLGFEVLICPNPRSHNTTVSMYTFIVKKIRTFRGIRQDLRFPLGLDPVLAKPESADTRELVERFLEYKDDLRTAANPEAEAVLSALAITRIFNFAQDIEERWPVRVQRFQITRDLRILVPFQDPRTHFYTHLARYLSKCRTLRRTPVSRAA